MHYVLVFYFGGNLYTFVCVFWWYNCLQLLVFETLGCMFSVSFMHFKQ